MALEHELHYKEISRNSASMTFDEAITAYIRLKDGVLSPATIAGYRRQQKNCFSELKNIKLNKLTQNKIQQAINEMAKNKSSKYVRNAHGLLSAVLKEYHPKFILKSALPQKKKYEATIPNSKETIILIGIVKDTPIELPVLLSIWMGLRMSEIRGIKWSAIKGNNLHINTAIVDCDNIPTEKGTKTYAGQRILELPPYIKTLIDRQPKDGEFIVTLSGQAIYKRFFRICEKNELPHFRFHDLRHANASILHALKIPNKYIMDRDGWASEQMLNDIYRHSISDEMKLVNITVNNYFEEIVSPINATQNATQDMENIVE